MNTILSKQKNFSFNGNRPLNYRDFMGTPPGIDSHTRRRFLLRLHMKGGSRLAMLFESGQWCFSEEIVDLAGLEDLEKILPSDSTSNQFPWPNTPKNQTAAP